MDVGSGSGSGSGSRFAAATKIDDSATRTQQSVCKGSFLFLYFILVVLLVDLLAALPVPPQNFTAVFPLLFYLFRNIFSIYFPRYLLLWSSVNNNNNMSPPLLFYSLTHQRQNDTHRPLKYKYQYINAYMNIFVHAHTHLTHNTHTQPGVCVLCVVFFFSADAVLKDKKKQRIKCTSYLGSSQP